MQEPWICGGFAFYDKNIADQASREVDAVDYLRNRLEGARPEVVYQMYQQIIRQKLFSTPVGYAYLKELRDYLTVTAGYEESRVETIPVEMDEAEPKKYENENSRVSPEKSGSSQKEKSERQQKNTPGMEKMQGRMHLLLGVNICLVVVIIAMFVINMTSNNTTILNYENQIIDKYESWEQELLQREAELKEREAMLQE
ncbi:MAG: hypothetical protein MR355_10280 [Lachnospiraceae bacterium]|nr:hypothetical protein [Lachnospiraceae bacterium]